jgi:hypothetical protein
MTAYLSILLREGKLLRSYLIKREQYHEQTKFLRDLLSCEAMCCGVPIAASLLCIGISITGGDIYAHFCARMVRKAAAKLCIFMVRSCVYREIYVAYAFDCVHAAYVRLRRIFACACSCMRELIIGASTLVHTAVMCLLGVALQSEGLGAAEVNRSAHLVLGLGDGARLGGLGGGLGLGDILTGLGHCACNTTGGN